MKEFWNYIVAQVTIAPQIVFEVLLSIFIIGTVALTILYGKNVARYLSRLLLAEYQFLVYGITVVFRTAKPKVTNFLTPFWNYKEIFKGEDPSLLFEVLLNVVLFIPIGLLWGPLVSKKGKKKQWLITFLLGIGLSLGIELLQLVFKKGSFEIDDIIHNTLGCFIGFLMWRGVSRLMDLSKTSCNSTKK